MSRQPRPTKPVPRWLQAMLSEHRAQFEPRFNGFLSDHLPMAALSMWHLRRPKVAIEAWATRYQRQLEPLQSPAYSTACAQFDHQIAREGIAATVRKALPDLLSGWVKDAFHPTIRLAYGMQFQLPGEVSAGLSYLTMVGPDPLLESYADTAEAATELVWPVFSPGTEGTFTEKAQRFLESPTPQPGLFGDDTLNRYAQAALTVMLQTRNFFALHLVTGLDAFRIATAPLPGSQQHWLAAGMLAGYAAANAQIEAPDPQRPNTAFRTDWEHDCKVVLACSGLAEASGSRAIESIRHKFAINLLCSPY